MIALIALFVGVVTGLFQALSHAGVNLYPQLTPVVASYYQGLTLHGVMNALVWTTFFICGFLPFVATRALGMPLASCRLAWGTYGLMTGGLVLAAIPLLGNAATVMFTFYPPLQAHWAFYVGLTLVVVGTWLVTLNLVLTYRSLASAAPRRAHAIGGVHDSGHLCDVDHRVARARRRNAGHAHPMVAGLAAWD